MPALGAISLEPHDNRLTGSARTYVSNANWQDGYRTPCSSSLDGVSGEITRVVMGDGETVYALGQYAVDTGAEAWSPGKDVLALSLTPSDASGDHAGGGTGCLHIYISQTLSAGQVGIYALYNNAGTNVTTTTYYGVSTNLNAPDTWGASVKKFNDAGTWKITVTLRVNGVDQATQTTSFGSTEPTIDFGTVHHGYLVTQGKGQTGIVDIGGVRVHTDSSYPESGTAWTLTDCDNIFNGGTTSANAKVRRPAVASAFDAQFYTVNALIYYGASGQNFNTWPDTNCKIKTLIPTGDPDETEMLTNTGATGTYTPVDDAFGGAVSTDYDHTTSSTSQYTQAFSFPAHGLTSKDVGMVGMHCWHNITADAGVPYYVLELNGVESARQVQYSSAIANWRWWLVKPAFSTVTSGVRRRIGAFI